MRLWLRDKTEAPTSIPAASPTGDSRRQVRAARRILALLQELVTARTLLGVGIAGTDEIRTSAMLEVVAERGYCVLDEFAPRLARELLVPGLRLTVDTVLRGARLRFRSILSDIGSAHGIEYYKVPLPEFVEHEQRRRFDRMILPIERAATVEFLDRDSRSCAGDVLDISAGGLSARLDPGSAPRFRVHDVLPGAVLYLAGQRHSTGPVEICHCEAPVQHKRARIGARFVAVPSHTARAIDGFIATLHRTHARRSYAY
jgi:c-di-GMP-binding flagellar brake protein YcgR